MICSRCLRRASALRPSSSITRAFSTANPSFSPATATPPPATSTGIAQPFSTPLTPAPSDVSLGVNLRPKSKIPLPVSICPAGTPMRGINYMKGKDDPVALKEEEYPEWLWRCLDVKKADDGEGGVEGDEFSKSKKLRRKAAKRQRKLEAARLASGDMSSLEPKIPLTQQSIDLPANEEGTIKGALEAGDKREELREAMRRERRSKIKESNFLKGM
ncbi:related to mitochondrial ribosomal protein L37p [Phialocephala subalpina]|uniref:Large ribosomal subunit protein mL54 n=1 Tax=Phialocephala subalpina TaxID=576137 RepID=A0A1L7XLT4_9HELO|nr:related to mitochondrial ribosomal protein L37p [Phialocephala subalpina]